jgi:hypothetical protein
MHRSRGKFAQPLPGSGGHGQRVCAALPTKGRAPVGSPATPAAAHVGGRHSSCIAAAATAATTAAPAISAVPPRGADDGEDCVGESQPLLPPPARDAASSYVCDWAQAIQCTLSSLKPEPCQREGCDVLVHHLCQGEWERREGYSDTVARLCCRHHPDYKYRGTPAKVDVAKAQDVISKAKAVHGESQVTTEGVEGSSGKDSEEGSKSGGSDDDGNDPLWVEPVLGGGIGGGSDDDDVGREIHALPAYDITDYTANEYDVHERTAHYMERRPISSYNRVAVEAVYMVKALTLVKSMKTMHKPEIAQRVQDKYKAFIQAIPLDRFADSSIKVMMEAKYFCAKGTSADGLLMKANEVLKNVCALVAGIRGVGTPLHQIPSGRSLPDMRNEFILKKWSAVQGTIYAPSNNDEELMLEVPDGWWLLNPTTNLLLAVLVHRYNPDVVADLTVVPTGQTRETLRNDSRKDTVERRERERIIAHHGMERQRAEDSMLALKAQLMAQTINSGTIDQVKEQLALLSQFKDSYVKVQNRIHGQGEADYD